MKDTRVVFDGTDVIVFIVHATVCPPLNLRGTFFCFLVALIYNVSKECKLVNYNFFQSLLRVICIVSDKFDMKRGCAALSSVMYQTVTCSSTTHTTDIVVFQLRSAYSRNGHLIRLHVHLLSCCSAKHFGTIQQVLNSIVFWVRIYRPRELLLLLLLLLSSSSSSLLSLNSFYAMSEISRYCCTFNCFSTP
jgi:hypothetical protein